MALEASSILLSASVRLRRQRGRTQWLEVFAEQAESDRLQRARHRGHLGQDIDAVLLLLDHLLQAAGLPLDAAQSLKVVVLVGNVAVVAR